MSKYTCSNCGLGCILELQGDLMQSESISICPLRLVNGLSLQPKWKMEGDIEPCPFCGNTDSLRIDGDESIESHNYSVNCDATNGGCGAQGGYDRTKELAVERWNQRG